MFIRNISSVIVTVISGVLVFIIGQILTTVWLTPLQQYKDMKKRIAYALSFYANIYTNVVDLAIHVDDEIKIQYDTASNELRELGCELSGFVETLSWMKIGIPKKENLIEASRNLIGLSNSLFSPYNCEEEHKNRDNRHRAKTIKKLLKCHSK